MDSKDNLYIAGDFRETVDFDPTAGTHNINEPSFTRLVFVAKYSPGNQLEKVFTIEGSRGINTMDVDASDNLYIGGNFLGTIDLDPGAGTANFTSTRGLDGFLAKYSPAGSYLEGYSMDGSVNQVKLDGGNNLCVSGSIPDSLDIDLKSGKSYLYSKPGGFDVYLARYDASFNLLFGRSMDGHSSRLRVGDLEVDKNDNIFLCGNFRDTVDFIKAQNGGELYSKGSRDGFIAKFDKSGTLVFARQIGSVQSDDIPGMSASGAIWLGGTYGDTADFDLGTGEHKLGTNGKQAIFLARYSDPNSTSVSRLKENTETIDIRTANSHLIIDFSRLKEANAEIRIINTQSQSVYRARQNRAEALRIALSELPSGQVLVVQVYNKGQRISHKLLIL